MKWEIAQRLIVDNESSDEDSRRQMWYRRGVDVIEATRHSQ